MYAESVLSAIGGTPLVELDAVRPPGGARVLAKWEGANPTGSMKDRMAVAMIQGARERGLLDDDQLVVELTGGSTGSSLAMVCAALDQPLTLVSADCFSLEKRRTMRALGADLEVLETPNGAVYPGLKSDMEDRVQGIVAETDAHWTDQFTNRDALDGYEALGAEILTDAPDVTDFVMGVGTGGCAMGTARRLRADRDVHVTLVEPDESAFLSTGASGDHHVEGVALGLRPPLLDDDLYDDVHTVLEADASEMARSLAESAGLFAGTSSGMNVAAAVDVASERDPDDVVVTVACDTGLKYLDGDLYRP